jgi:hypothetical protein
MIPELFFINGLNILINPRKFGKELSWPSIKDWIENNTLNQECYRKIWLFDGVFKRFFVFNESSEYGKKTYRTFSYLIRLKFIGDPDLQKEYIKKIIADLGISYEIKDYEITLNKTHVERGEK